MSVIDTDIQFLNSVSRCGGKFSQSVHKYSSAIRSTLKEDQRIADVLDSYREVVEERDPLLAQALEQTSSLHSVMSSLHSETDLYRSTVVTAFKTLSDDIRRSLKELNKDVMKKEAALRSASDDTAARMAKRLERAEKKRAEQVESLMQTHKRRSMELLVSYLGQFTTLFKQLQDHATSIETAIPEYRASSTRKLKDAQLLTNARDSPRLRRDSSITSSPSLDKTSSVIEPEEESESPGDMSEPIQTPRTALLSVNLPHLAAPLPLSSDEGSTSPLTGSWSGRGVGFLAFSDAPAVDKATQSPISTRRSTSDRDLQRKVTIVDDRRQPTRSVSTGMLAKQRVEKAASSDSSAPTSTQNSRRSSLAGQATGFMAFADSDTPPTVSFDECTASSSRASMIDIAAELDWEPQDPNAFNPGAAETSDDNRAPAWSGSAAGFMSFAGSTPETPDTPSKKRHSAKQKNLQRSLDSFGISERKRRSTTKTRAQTSSSNLLVNVVFVSDDTVEYGEKNSEGLRPIRAATLDRLIERLTPEDFVDSGFRKCFLLTYRSFADPTTVLLKLQERFALRSTSEDEGLKTRRLRVIAVLKDWVENYFYDFDDTEPLLKVISNMKTVLPTAAASIELLVTRKQQETQENSVPIFGKNLGRIPDLDWTQLYEQDLAAALTLVESDIFCRISPKEVITWTTGNKEVRAAQAKNILALVNHFNRVSQWVTTQICVQVDRAERVSTIRKFINLADQLCELNNLNGVMEVISGLSSSAVIRMLRTFDRLSPGIKARLEALKKLMSTDNNYGAYRERLATSSPPLLPYIGIFFTDLTFISDGNPSIINGLINFSKCDLIYKVMREIVDRQVPFNLQVSGTLMQFMSNLPILTAKECYTWSRRLEPKDLDAAESVILDLIEQEKQLKLENESMLKRLNELEQEIPKTPRRTSRTVDISTASIAVEQMPADVQQLPDLEQDPETDFSERSRRASCRLDALGIVVDEKGSAPNPRHSRTSHPAASILSDGEED
mmetsp:Transcript_5456/g.16679  ORF Transcript_5456/g.16679 Transcript_5456/m.16679 type:complete len:1010 (+) Transcript_5456:72-3101(+)